MEKAFDSLPREGGAFRVLRRNDKGQIKMLDVLARDSVLNPDDLLSSVQQRWGGGRYYVVPTRDGKKAGDGFGLEFEGEPKKTKKKADDNTGQKRTSKLTETEKELEEAKAKLQKMEADQRDEKLMREIRSLRDEFRANDGRKEVNYAEVMESMSATVKNLQGAVPQARDPMENIAQLTDLILKINQGSRPPVSTTGSAQSGGAAASFVAAVLSEIGHRITSGIPGGVGPQGIAGALPGLPASAAPGFAGAPEGSSQQSGFSGIPDGTTQETATEQAPKTEEGPNIFAGFDMKSLGLDPLASLRQMLLERRDVLDVSEVALYLVNFLAMFAPPGSPIAAYAQAFFANPGMMFDQAVPLLPELQQADAQYVSDLRAAIIEDAASYVRERANQGAPQGDESAEETLTPEERQQAEQWANTESEDAAENVQDREAESEGAEEVHT